MPTPEVEITRREEFSAAHRLHNPALTDAENEALYGLCNNPNGHGHNYALEVTLRGPVPEGTGMVMDLNRLMVLLREEVISQLDHRNLNYDVSWLKDVITTAENIAVVIWSRIEPHLKGIEGCRLQRVRLYESRDNFVDYLGPRR